MRFFPQRAAIGLARLALKAASLDPSNMTAEQLVASIFGSSTTMRRLGAAELLKAYGTHPWFRAVVDRVSWRAATTQWKLYVATGTKDEGGKAIRRRSVARAIGTARRKEMKALAGRGQLREITTHRALDLLDQGNPIITGPLGRQVTQQHLDMVGESLWILDLDGLGLPTDFWPIPPTWVVRKPTTSDPTWQINGRGGVQTLQPEQVLYFFHPAPSDPYEGGTGIGQVLGDELETDEAAAKHLKRWFKNYARPDLLITGDGLKGPEIDRLEQNWLGKISGKPGVPYFSNRNLDVHEFAHTFAEMQLSQLRKDERDIIIHVYGVPPEVFGIIENSNRATIDAADYLMGKYVDLPRLEFMRIILQERLIERYDDRLILDYVSPIEEDHEFQLKVIQAAPYAFTVDQIRALGGQPPLETPGGDGHMVPFNYGWVPSLDVLADLQTSPAPAPALTEA